MVRAALVGLAALLAVAAGSGSALAQTGTAFTYQGQLGSNGAAVSGNVDVQFQLFNAAVAGTSLAGPVTVSNIAVSNGLFSTPVDLGVNPYTSAQPLWLQISVRNPATTGAWVPMTARQQITAAPYSLATRGITVDSAGNAILGTTNPAPSPGRLVAQGAWATGSGKVILNPTNWGASGVSGDGAGLISISDGNGGERAFLGVSASPDVDTVLAATGGGTQLRLVGSQQGIGFYTLPGTTSLGGFGGTRGTAAMTLDANGNLNVSTGAVAIGSVDYSQRLTVTGNIRATGTVIASCGTLSCSSIRFKENVQEMTDALDSVSRLRGVTFDWKPEHAEDRGYTHDIGLIAEEVNEVFPSVTFREKDGQIAGLDYGRLSAVAIEAIKQLRAEKDAQIAELEAKNRDLESRLARLEAMAGPKNAAGSK